MTVVERPHHLWTLFLLVLGAGGAIMLTVRTIAGEIPLWEYILLSPFCIFFVLVGIFFMYRKTWLMAEGIRMRTFWICRGKPVVLSVFAEWTTIGKIEVEPIFKHIIFYSDHRISTHNCSPHISSAGYNVILNRREVLRFIGNKITDLNDIEVGPELVRQIERSRKPGFMESFWKSVRA